VVKVYPIAVGAPVSPSPAGEFRVHERITNPTYYAPGKVIGPGKSNPLGTRWIGLGHRGYGIHGTNEPRSIGKNASHGCIRMNKKDVEELFELVHAGDLVVLHAERSTEIAMIFGDAPATPATPSAPAVKTQPAVVATVM
jgi:lipoprotein-anchoring transpeptidase ErfK/SrfK